MWQRTCPTHRHQVCGAVLLSSCWQRIGNRQATRVYCFRFAYEVTFLRNPWMLWKVLALWAGHSQLPLGSAQLPCSDRMRCPGYILSLSPQLLQNLNSRQPLVHVDILVVSSRTPLSCQFGDSRAIGVSMEPTKAPWALDGRQKAGAAASATSPGEDLPSTPS